MNFQEEDIYVVCARFKPALVHIAQQFPPAQLSPCEV